MEAARRAPEHADDRLLRAVRQGLARIANPEKAEPMRAYMKSALPFRGVSAPDRRRLLRQVFAEHPIDDRRTWETTTRTLWDEAAFREERYAAIELTDHRDARRWQDVDALALYEHLIITGAWWDYVDELAIRRVGPILRGNPARVRPMLLRWAIDDDLWRRRTAILAQNGSKIDTDSQLLAEVIDRNLDANKISQDFFIRKGIGWALREYAKTDPAWVREFVLTHRDRLSPLSYREATKHL